MFDQRLKKAHDILRKLEDIRFQLTIVGTIANPCVSESKELELMIMLEETEMLIDNISKLLYCNHQE